MKDFESLYTIYFKEIYYFLLDFTKNDSVAKDLTSETFFKALKNLKDFRGEASVRSYLFQIAKNTYFSYYKKSKREIITEDIEVFDRKIESLEEYIIEKERNMKVINAVNILKEPYRTVVSLRIWEDMSFKSIGKIYNKSDNWACVTFHRAKNMLKEILEEDYEE